MNTVLFVNNAQKACGVYQYGKRVAKIFKGSLKFNTAYAEPANSADLAGVVSIVKPAIIIFNYLTVTMPWLTQGDVDGFRKQGIKLGLIVHHIGYSQMFDFYLHQHPRWACGRNNYALLRPLFNYHKPSLGTNTPPRIGSFGFAFGQKQYPKICQFVNDQFTEAELHMHLTISYYQPNAGWPEGIRDECSRIVTKPGIKVVITSDFKEDEDILDFLAGNDLNVFLYDYFPSYNGLSSTIDYALSAGRPVAVNHSGLFSHINDATPSICLEDSTLPQILENGVEPIRKFQEAWTNASFISHLEEILDSL